MFGCGDATKASCASKWHRVSPEHDFSGLWRRVTTLHRFERRGVPQAHAQRCTISTCRKPRGQCSVSAPQSWPFVGGYLRRRSDGSRDRGRWHLGCVLESRPTTCTGRAGVRVPWRLGSSLGCPGASACDPLPVRYRAVIDAHACVLACDGGSTRPWTLCSCSSRLERCLHTPCRCRARGGGTEAARGRSPSPLAAPSPALACPVVMLAWTPALACLARARWHLALVRRLLTVCASCRTVSILSDACLTDCVTRGHAHVGACVCARVVLCVQLDRGSRHASCR